MRTTIAVSTMPRDWELLLGLDLLTIDQVREAPRHTAGHGVILLAKSLDRRLHHGFPEAALLAARELRRRVLVVITAAASLPVVIVVGNQMRVDVLGAQPLGKTLIVGLPRSPASMQETESAGEQVVSRRHSECRIPCRAAQCEGNWASAGPRRCSKTGHCD